MGENGILINPSASAYILYALSCVQWCLGMPAGEKPDSYKSKMNKNIGRWLIKELQRKGIPPQLPADVTHAAQSVISHILEHNIDADFAQELASIIGIPGFVPAPKMPSPSPRCTAESPLHSYETRFSYDSTNGHHVPYSNPIAHNVIGRADPFHPIKELVSSNASIHQLHAALPRLSVDHRLFLLVAKTHGGLLGARIPSLYREIFGERLRLQGRKLKDILLGKTYHILLSTMHLTLYLTLLIMYCSFKSD